MGLKIEISFFLKPASGQRIRTLRSSDTRSLNAVVKETHDSGGSVGADVVENRGEGIATNLGSAKNERHISIVAGDGDVNGKEAGDLRGVGKNRGKTGKSYELFR